MSISEKQLEANRRNAQRSTGPKTDDGKARSSRNNLRHGLTGQVTVLPGEDREVHDAFCNELMASLKPETPMERDLAQSIAEDSWRLNRAVAIDANMFALGRGPKCGKNGHEIRNALADARTFQERAAQFNLLTLYEQRINRNRQRNLKQLQELQAERAQHTEETQTEQTEPVAEANGFEFSNTEIAQPAPVQPDFDSPTAAPGHQYVTTRAAAGQSTPDLEIKRAA